MASDVASLWRAIEQLTIDFKLCRNRVWAVAKTLLEVDRGLLLQIPTSRNVQQRGIHKDHEQCTFDFCEHSRLDFTSVGQRHESCPSQACKSRTFEPRTLEKAALAGKPTAWTLDGKSMIESPQPFMAISHVWSDGTGSGAWPPGQVNECLYEFFKKIAKQFQCEGIWWDTLCIPREKAARSKAVINIQRNYEDARITLVHDCFLREWEWVNAELACFAIIMSPWFSRGWTALELSKSRKVKVLFKGPQGPLVKDLDQDILAQPDSASPRHQVASKLIVSLRRKRIDEIDQLLVVLGPRHTSWPRDVAIISGHLTAIEIGSNLSQQKIYQDILKRVGKISHENLFHNSAPMSNHFSWCPTSIFDMPQSSTRPTLKIQPNGEVIGDWVVFQRLQYIPSERYNWKDTHPIIQAQLRLSLDQPDRHVLLIDPENQLIAKALLVKIIGQLRVKFVGPVYYHPPFTGEELGEVSLARVIIGDSELMEEIRTRSRNSQGSGLLLAAADGNTAMVNELLMGKGTLKVQDEEKKTALHLAAQNGHKAAVDFLLDKGAKRNIQDKGKRTALHLAAQNGHEGVVEALLRGGARHDLPDENTWTALHYATWRGYAEVVQKLVEGGADRSIRDNLGQNPFHLAAERGNVEILDRLFPEMYQHYVIDSSYLNAQCHDNQTVLHRAAWGGSQEVVRVLLRYSGDVNALDNHKRTALHVAAEKGYVTVCDLLLQYGAVPNAQDSKEQTALHLAAENGHDEVIELLLKTNADLNREDKSGWTPLLLAVQNGHAAAVRTLLANGADMETENANGRTPLLWAAGRGHKSVVRLLVEKNARLEYRDSNSQTPLLSAAENGHVDVVELLLDKGAERESRDNSGQTPLLWAAERGHEAVVRLLLDWRADREVEDNNGQTPLLSAAKNGREGVVKLLLERGADVTSRDGLKRTALSWAAQNGHVAVVKLLIKYHSPLEDRDKDNYTPLALAAEQHEAVVKLLLESGAEVDSPDDGGHILQWAASQGNAEIVELLLSKGPGVVNLEYGRIIGTPLSLAARRGHERVVKLMLEHKANPNSPDPDGRTPLALALQRSRPLVLKLLLENGAVLESKEQGGQIMVWALKEEHSEVAMLALKKGAGIETQDREGRTPLSWAAEKGYEDVVQALLAKHARVESTDQWGSWPLWYAAKHDHPNVINLLIRHRANIEFSQNGMTALVPAMDDERKEAMEALLQNGAKITNEWMGGKVLLWSAKNGYERLAELLLRQKANIRFEYQDRDDRTSLSWAAGNGHEGVVRLLLRNGAQLGLRDKDGQTPLFYAAGNADDTIVKLLIANGAQVDARDNYGRTALSRAEAYGRKAMIQVLQSYTH